MQARFKARSGARGFGAAVKISRRYMALITTGLEPYHAKRRHRQQKVAGAS